MSETLLESSFAISGTFIHSTITSPLVILSDHCIGVISGKIVFIQKNDNKINDVLEKYNIDVGNIICLKGLQFVIPGFVDTHIHAPQYSNCGKCLDEDMLSWLHKYTFPTEAKFADLDFATKQYWKVVSRVVKNGTTTASYFGTIHTNSTLKLCDVIQSIGQRGIVGKVNMNRNSPDYYKENTTISVQETKRYVQEVVMRKYTLIRPCITPRYAGNCCMGLMKQLGQIARSNEIHVQTVLAHGIYLTPEDRKLIRERNCGISHCPNSNISIRSGMLDVRACLDDNISVGLGTDISGGYSPSILDAMRTAIFTSNTIALHKGPNYKPLDYQDVFRLATLGGAKVLDMEDHIGNFEVGKAFDALLVDPCVDGGPIDVFREDTMEDIIQKFIFLGDDRNILSVFVAGNDILENFVRQISSPNDGI
ncbi:guanine deaminase-like isoform X2 [Ylistrum balloti]|uniref:guanine deaminase-like isoform X2 n=1 Tax=Ylistrum balloti TaxID=509963 RepID=UPI0029058B00|nr:guanine deaminase-like isoform X2 [Ylistrum balloti]